MSALIDPNGVWWPADSPWLRMSYGVGAGQPDFDFPRYAVRNLRFARLRHDDHRMHICFRPGTLTEKTMDQVGWAILGVPVARFGLDRLQGPDGLEVISNAEDALERFLQIASAPGVLERPRYHAQPLSLQQLGVARLTPLRHALMQWWGAEKLLSAQGPAWQHEQKLWMLTRIKDGVPIIESIGQGYSNVDRAWLAKAPGMPLDAHPDTRYGAALMASYKEAAMTGQPTLELVDAEVVGPQGPVRARYERLLLPWHGVGRRQKLVLVSSCTIMRTVLPALRPG